MAQLSVALASARALLGDVDGTQWTDAILIPLAQEAHRELQVDLWNAGSPVVRHATPPLQVMAGSMDLGVNQPQDMINPTHLVEGPSSVGIDWEPMTEVLYIPVTAAQGPKLNYWCWRAELIRFLGATVERWVIVYYRRLILVPTLSTSLIGIIFGEMYLGPRIAALAAGAGGNEKVYAMATALAKENFAKVVAANRGRQAPLLSQ